MATSISSMRGAEDLAGYIARNYRGRVVEVGVGYYSQVAGLLAAQGLQVTLTDREERLVAGLKVEKDDIFSPRLELYRGAGLIYSIRPPLEIQLAIGVVAAEIEANVLIRPLMEEVARLPGFSRRLVNWGRASFYLYGRDKHNATETAGSSLRKADKLMK
ncbi:MAG: hypothetical protein GX463_06655 [Methanothrix sp.]|nr:hypothetical protein [Methanothrix sp.]HNU40497.1 UPF0146 family protein [Methanothrix sp.]HPA98368.1 UPF0146 family protein [Methanothrix sp.]